VLLLLLLLLLLFITPNGSTYVSYTMNSTIKRHMNKAKYKIYNTGNSAIADKPRDAFRGYTVVPNLYNKVKLRLTFTVT